jgi:hypothetical protein
MTDFKPTNKKERDLFSEMHKSGISRASDTQATRERMIAQGVGKMTTPSSLRCLVTVPSIVVALLQE